MNSRFGTKGAGRDACVARRAASLVGAESADRRDDNQRSLSGGWGVPLCDWTETAEQEEIGSRYTPCSGHGIRSVTSTLFQRKTPCLPLVL